jgi:hypothetical protein
MPLSQCKSNSVCRLKWSVELSFAAALDSRWELATGSNCSSGHGFHVSKCAKHVAAVRKHPEAAHVLSAIATAATAVYWCVMFVQADGLWFLESVQAA